MNPWRRNHFLTIAFHIKLDLMFGGLVSLDKAGCRSSNYININVTRILCLEIHKNQLVTYVELRKITCTITSYKYKKSGGIPIYKQ
jgi:hypothetical protein